MNVKNHILHDEYTEETLGICPGSTPDYVLENGLTMLVDELMMVVGYSFANANMGNYPPSNTTRLYAACQTFTSPDLDSFGKVRQFLAGQLPPYDEPTCWNFKSQLPSGPNATVSSGDWSGVGTGDDGEGW